MGMLLSYHKGYYPKGAEPKGHKPEKRRRSRTRRGDEPTPEPVAPADPEVSPYAELTDEQVAEAYTTNVLDGDTSVALPSREDQVAALEALDAEPEPEPEAEPEPTEVDKGE